MMLLSLVTVRFGHAASVYSSGLPSMWPTSWAAVPPVLFRKKLPMSALPDPAWTCTT
jgi:hypothetical protein